jgi:hypothetical protein
MLRKLFLAPMIYLGYVLLTALSAALVGGIIAFFFPTVGLIIFGLGVLGGFINAWEKTRDKLGDIHEDSYQKKLSRQFRNSELAEFDRALKQVSRKLY